MSNSPISANWPFDARRSPIFYGWVIWFFSTLGFLMSVPGQTMGMAVFTDPFIDGMGLSRTQLSMAYLIGTVTSSLFLTRAGRWYDKFGGRALVALSGLVLGIMVFYISCVDIFSRFLADLFSTPLALVSFLLIVPGYFGVRFWGQGVLTSASRNVMLMWFEKRRGLVSGIRGVFVSMGFSLAPLFLAALILEFGWRQALWVLAFIVGVLFAFAAVIFLRDDPESCGLLADGEVHDENFVARVVKESNTLTEARHSPLFWIYSLSLGMHALFGTALTFHIVDVFHAAGRTREEAFGYFFPAAIVSTSVNLVASWMADFSPLKPFLVAMLLSFLAGAWGLLHLEETWGFWMLACGFGAGGGLWGLISNLAFIRFFGTLHLGAISGLNTSLTVFASAIGPAMFSLGVDYFGTYKAAEWVCTFFLMVLLVAAVLIPQDEET
jgi:MFS family permease